MTAAEQTEDSAPSFVTGFDISRWQGTNDFVAAARAGHEFVFIKASEGIGYTDPKFKVNWKLADEAGLLRGAYHFARVSRRGVDDSAPDDEKRAAILKDAGEEAAWFAEVMGTLDSGDLNPVLDIEWDKRAKGIKAWEVLAWCKEFLERLEELTGRLPIVYTGYSFWRYKLLKTRDLDRYPLWFVEYTDDPEPTKPIELKDEHGNVAWRWEPTFWQWSRTLAVPGIGDRVDGNRFFGTMTDLRRLAGYRAPEPVPDPEPAPDPGDSVVDPLPVPDPGSDLPEPSTKENCLELLVAFFKELFTNRRADLISAADPPEEGLDAAGGNV